MVLEFVTSMLFLLGAVYFAFKDKGPEMFGCLILHQLYYSEYQKCAEQVRKEYGK
jgi:hypothetical protein